MKNRLKYLQARIQEKISHLTEHQKIIINYILDNPRLFALSSIRELESKLNTSKATIVRLAQALGYEGFQELKSEFLESVKNELDPIHKYKKFISERENQSDYLKMISDENVENINKSLELIEPESYLRAIDFFKNANHIYTMGMKMSNYLAEIAAYLFNRISLNASPMVYGGLKFTERIVNMSDRDVILAFAFHPYSPETVEAACYARERNVPVIAVTDSSIAEIIEHSDVVLQVAVKTSGISNSITTGFILISSIVAQIGHDLKNKTLKTIEAIDHIREEHTGAKKNSPS